MHQCEKTALLNGLMWPLGFFYDTCQDVISSTIDSWQREFGYQSLYDCAAPRFNMVFDCEPVYFDYDGRTWLIEFWKGQYGINTGAEIGVYHADTVLLPSQYAGTLFQSAFNEEMLPLSMELLLSGETLFTLERQHWWLTGFSMGKYCEPDMLEMKASLTFPDHEMMEGFLEGLTRAGYEKNDICVCGHTVSFAFSRPHTDNYTVLSCLHSRLSQWENRTFCRMFQRITRPFTCTSDRLLYLYYFLPFAFHHTLKLHSRRRRQK